MKRVRVQFYVNESDVQKVRAIGRKAYPKVRDEEKQEWEDLRSRLGSLALVAISERKF